MSTLTPGFSRPPSFNPSHPSRSDTSSGMVDRKKMMQNELGFDEADMKPDDVSEEEVSDDDDDDEGEDEQPAGLDGSRSRAGAAASAVARSASSAALSRSVMGSGFGEARKASSAAINGSSTAGNPTEAGTNGSHSSHPAYRDLQEERDRLAADKANLEARLASFSQISRGNMGMQRKILMEKLKARDAHLQAFTDRLAELEGRVSALGAAAASAVTNGPSGALSAATRSTLVKLVAETEKLDAQTSASVSSLGGSMMSSPSAPDVLALSSIPETLEAAQTDLLSTRAELQALRSGTATVLAQLYRLKDAKREFAAVAETAHPTVRSHLLSAVSAMDAAERSSADAGMDFVDLLASRTSGPSTGGAAGGEGVNKELMTELKRDRLKLEQAKTQLSAMMKASEESKAAMQRVSTEKEELTRKLTAYAEERDKFRAKLKELLQERDAAVARAVAAEAHATGAQGAVISAAEAAAADARLQEANARIDELQKQLEAARADADAAQQAAAASMARIEKDAGALSREVQQLRAALTSAESERNALRTAAESTTASASKGVAELQQRMAALTAEMAELSKKKDAEADALRRQVSKAQEDAAASAASLAAEKTTAVSSMQQQLTAVQTSLAEATAEISRLQENVRAANAGADATMTTLREEHSKVIADLEAKAAQREASIKSKAQAQLDTHVTNYEAKLQSVTTAHADETAKLNARIKQVASVTDRIASVAAGATSSATAVRAAYSSMRKDVRSALGGMTDLFSSSGAELASRFASHAEAVNVLMGRYKKELAERRKLHNLVQELRGNIRVYCRARPALPFELEAGASVAVAYPADGEIAVTNNKKQVKTWEFDCVFPPTADNATIFKDTEPLITSAMDGYNVCIFAYGQTGSGKTFTMEGNEESRGVNYRALDTLFGLRDERKADMKYEIAMAMLEIYNEAIHDILATRSASGEAARLTVREGPQGNFVPDLIIKPVENLEEVLKIMRSGYKNRTTFATNMNERSSRSHCMVSLYVTGTHRVTGAVMRGKLHLIDLAGSERVGKSGVTGDRLKEAQAINKSLSALGDVIQARAEKRGHVPYRNSTLTWLLSDSLGGDSKTLMFVNLSPILSNAEETYCSLNFASRVRSVELGKATKHTSGGGKAASASTPKAGADSDADAEDDGVGSADGSFEDLPDGTPEAEVSGAAAVASPMRKAAPAGSKPPMPGGPPGGPAAGSAARRMLASKK